MKELKKLPGREEYKVFKVDNFNIRYYRYNVSELLKKENASVVVTKQSDCVQVSIHLEGGFPDFEDCVKIKQFIFDEEEAVFLILKNLRIVDNRNIDIRMFFSEEINEQARKMDFEKQMEETFLYFTKKRPVIKSKRQFSGVTVHVIAMENEFPPLQEVEDNYKFALKLPLLAIKDSQTALNSKHMIFVCDGEKLKIPRTLQQMNQVANVLR